MRETLAESVQFSDDSMTVQLDDGRAVSIPLSWYPRLLHGSREERNRWRLIGRGVGIHWPDLDEDLSFRGIMEGDYGQHQNRRTDR